MEINIKRFVIKANKLKERKRLKGCFFDLIKILIITKESFVV